jgi:hypothetical protein
MRILLIVAIAAGAFIGAMAVSSNRAEAVVCAAGVRGAGCAGPHGAVVCRRWGIVGGVRRCVAY